MSNDKKDEKDRGKDKPKDEPDVQPLDGEEPNPNQPPPVPPGQTSGPGKTS